MPSRKWFAARVTACAALATSVLTTGGWDTEEKIVLVGIVAEGLISWLTPNRDPDPTVAITRSARGR